MPRVDMSLVGASSDPRRDRVGIGPGPRGQSISNPVARPFSGSKPLRSRRPCPAAPVGPRISKGKASSRLPISGGRGCGLIARFGDPESEPVAKPTELEAQVAGGSCLAALRLRTPAAAANAPAAPTPRPARPAGKSTVGNQPNTVAKAIIPQAVGAESGCFRRATGGSCEDAGINSTKKPRSQKTSRHPPIRTPPPSPWPRAAPPSVNVVSSAEALPSAPQVPTATHGQFAGRHIAANEDPCFRPLHPEQQSLRPPLPPRLTQTAQRRHRRLLRYRRPGRDHSRARGSVIQAAAATAIARRKRRMSRCRRPLLSRPLHRPRRPKPHSPPPIIRRSSPACTASCCPTRNHDHSPCSAGTGRSSSHRAGQQRGGRRCVCDFQRPDHASAEPHPVAAQNRSGISRCEREKLQVSQMPRDPSRQEPDSQSKRQTIRATTRPASTAKPAARDQQRREMLRRMWKRVSGNDDLDLIA